MRTVHYILVHFSILQQSQVIAAVAKVSCKHGLWLVDRVNNMKKLLPDTAGVFSQNTKKGDVRVTTW